MAAEANGVVTQLTRYPVKSMAGECLEEAELVSTGLYGDRLCALIDETKEGWERYVTARQVPELLAFRAAVADNGRPGRGTLPAVRIEGPDGRLYEWDEALLHEVQRYAKPKLSLYACDPDSELLAVDSAPILIVAEQMLERLALLVGKEAGFLRFRPNIVVRFPDGLFGNEQELVGKQLRIGDAVVRIVDSCERCSMITIDPETLERNPVLLKTVHREMNLRFGLYASVLQAGKIKLGDKVNVEYSLDR